jgi:hypothetical protein
LDRCALDIAVHLCTAFANMPWFYCNACCDSIKKVCSKHVPKLTACTIRIVYRVHGKHLGLQVKVAVMLAAKGGGAFKGLLKCNVHMHRLFPHL